MKISMVTPHPTITLGRLLAIFTALMISGLQAYAGTITVNCNQSDTLQSAINNAAPGSTIIVIGTCTGPFTVSKNLTLQGQLSPTLNGAGSGTVLTISAGVDVKVTGFVITNGSSGLGGGIYNQGILSLVSSTLTGNTVEGGGGGILNNGGTLTVTKSTVSGNNGAYGGGIYNVLGGKVMLMGSTVTKNTASQNGGGILNTSGATLTMSGTKVVGNSTNGDGGGLFNNATLDVYDCSVVATNSGSVQSPGSGFGGGVFNDAQGILTLHDSAEVTGNMIQSSGGGIYNNGGNVTLQDSAVVSGNTASGDSSYNGGGVYNSGGNLTLKGSARVTGNVVSGHGGGIFTSGGTFDKNDSAAVIVNIPDQIAH